MSFPAIGLIFFLVALGFFLSWGNPGAGENLTTDLILGGIFALVGYSIMTYRNPLTDVTGRFIRAANQVMDDPSILISTESAKEGVHRIRDEARKATRAIKERAQNRIDRIAREADDPALERTES